MSSINIDPDDPGCAAETEASKKEEIIEFKANLVLKKGATSEVWKHFIFKGPKSKGPKKDKVHCLKCKEKKKDSELPYSGGTSNLIFHLKKYHNLNIAGSSASDPPDKITAYKWPKSSIRWIKATKAIATWFCEDTRATTIVEDEGFKNLLAILCPEYDVPCPRTISNYIDEMYEKEKKVVVEDLKNVEFVATTTDGGSSLNAVSFQDTNVHFLDEDLDMKSYTLGVQENKEKHTAENYRIKNDELLDEFGVKEKVVKTVTDNEAKMKLAYSDEEREGCIAHIFHSSITKGCDEVPIVKNTIAKTRKIAKKHNKSYAMRYGLQQAQKKRKIKTTPLKQDVPTRWGSTRASMESFLDEKPKKEYLEKEVEDLDDVQEPEKFVNCDAINEALRNIKYKKKADVHKFLLTNLDMNRIKSIHKFLTRLDIFTTTLGGNNFVTISIVLPVVKSMMNLLKPDEEDVSYIIDLKKSILEDFKERIQSNLDLQFLVKTVALDPRFKNMKVVDDKPKREQTFRDLEEEMRAHLKKTNEDEPEKSEQGQEKKRKLCLDFEESDEENEDSPDEISQEMMKYKNDPILDRDSDPLAWWKKRKETYPNLVRLVRKYLCVPATSTQAERIFSALGLLLTKRRLSMTGENVNKQLFLRSNLRSKRKA